MDRRPPAILRGILIRGLPPGPVRDGLVGDLDELWAERRARHGRVRAHLWYARQVAGAVLSYLPARVGVRRDPVGRPVVAAPFVSLGDLSRDLRFGLHALVRRPLLAVVSGVTVALGVGATTVVVSVVHALLIRPLPVADPATLFTVNEDRSGRTSAPLGVDAVPYERFLAYQDALDEVFSGLAAEQFGSYALSAGDAAAAVSGFLVSGSYFRVLGVEPALGRFFARDDEASVVLGHGLWRGRFGGDPDIVGRTLRVDSRPLTVVGVAPPGFRGTTHGLSGEIWLPVVARNEAGQGGETWVTFFGRLRPGVGVDRAAAEVDAVARRLPPLQPQTRVRGAVLEAFTGFPATVRPYVQRFLVMLLGMAVLVLLIAGANIAGVLLARGAGRRREMAVRVSLGAGRGRLVRQLLAESVLMFTIGGAAGVGLAVAATRLMERVQPAIGFEVSFDLAPEPVVLLLALVVAGGTGLLFGLAPAFSASGGDPARGLKDGAGGAGDGGRGRSLFVGGQVALSVLLLVTAGLFVRSVQEALAVDLGFDPEGVVIGVLELDVHGYDGDGSRRFQERLLERIRGVPQVTAVTLSTGVPLAPAGGRSTSDARPEEAGPGAEPRTNVAFASVAPGYFDAMAVPLVTGRGFNQGDAEGARAVTVVNRALAERLWPGQPPLGQRVHILGRSFEVVGVTATGKYLYLNEPPSPFAWFPLAQRPSSTVTLHVRSRLSPAEALRRIREALSALDPDVALHAGMPLSRAVGLTIFPQRFAAVLVGVFGLVGALLAAVGVYGILAHDVARRTHEIGIRLALGAQPERLRGEVVRRGMVVTGVAVAVGVLMAALASRVVAGLMIGVSRLDPAAYAAAVVLLGGVALAASWLPARRATRVDPVEALRAE